MSVKGAWQVLSALSYVLMSEGETGAANFTQLMAITARREVQMARTGGFESTEDDVVPWDLVLVKPPRGVLSACSYHTVGKGPEAPSRSRSA